LPRNLFLRSSVPCCADELFGELEEALIASDVSTRVAVHAVDLMRAAVRDQGIREVDAAKDVLRAHIAGVLDEHSRPLVEDGVQRPLFYLIVGVNGTGKTTTIAKLAARFQRRGERVLLAAADTFRAAAIDQLAVWAERLDVDLVRQQPGSDPAAVVFDGIRAARARGADLVIADTAGRLHTKHNLMEELRKMDRVARRELGRAPDETLLVLDATTGQNAVAQAQEFRSAVGITGAVMAKLDGTAKGGTVIAIAAEVGVPVKLIGTGEGVDDLEDFDPQQFAELLLP
jgi:fused signal recognition particle receptor